MDPVIAQAAEVASLDSTQIHATFPSELTMWIDPLEVSYRIGENGSICVLYEFKEDNLNEPWRPQNKTSNENTKNQANQNSSSNTTNNNKRCNKPGIGQQLQGDPSKDGLLAGPAQIRLHRAAGGLR